MTRLDFRIQISARRIYNGRWSVFAALTIGRVTWWIQRWDTARISAKPRTIVLWRGTSGWAPMTWNCGYHALAGGGR